METTKMSECGRECWEGKGKSAVSFTSGFLMLFSLLWCYFRSNRFARHHHAVRRSSMRGIQWNLSHHPMSIAMIGAGVCIKSIHPYAASSKVDRAYVRTFVLCVGFSLLSTCYEQVLHPGWDAFWNAPRMRAKRLGYFFGKVLLAFACLLELAFPKETEGYQFMLYVCLLTCTSAFLVSLEKSPKIDKGLWYYVDHAVSNQAMYQDHDTKMTVVDETEPIGGHHHGHHGHHHGHHGHHGHGHHGHHGHRDHGSHGHHRDHGSHVSHGGIALSSVPHVNVTPSADGGHGAHGAVNGNPLTRQQVYYDYDKPHAKPGEGGGEPNGTSSTRVAPAHAGGAEAPSDIVLEMDASGNGGGHATGGGSWRAPAAHRSAPATPPLDGGGAPPPVARGASHAPPSVARGVSLGNPPAVSRGVSAGSQGQRAALGRSRVASSDRPMVVTTDGGLGALSLLRGRHLSGGTVQERYSPVDLEHGSRAAGLSGEDRVEDEDEEDEDGEDDDDESQSGSEEDDTDTSSDSESGRHRHAPRRENAQTEEEDINTAVVLAM